MNVSGGAVTETTISGLDFSNNYSFEMAAVNNFGIGPYSEPKVFTRKSKHLDNLDTVDFIYSSNNVKVHPFHSNYTM